MTPHNNSGKGPYYIFLWDNTNVLSVDWTFGRIQKSLSHVENARNLDLFHCENYLFLHCFDDPKNL